MKSARTRILLLAVLAALLPGATNAAAQTPAMATVQVECRRPDGSFALGSGFLWGDRGTVVTALHVVAGSPSIKLYSRSEGTCLRASVARVLLRADLALLKVDGAFASQPLVGASRPAARDDRVRVHGHPEGIRNLDETELRVRNGSERLEDIVPEDVRRELRDFGMPATGLRVLNLEGSLLPGHSGGPVVDGQGRLVGIANGGLALGTVDRSWAVPSDELQALATSSEAEPPHSLLPRIATLFRVSTGDHEQSEPPVYSRGELCVGISGGVDLDDGVFLAAGGDLRLANESFDRRRLEGAFVSSGKADFEALAPWLVDEATIAPRHVRADAIGSELTPGTVLLVRTDEGRLSKVVVLEAAFVKLRWVTWARPGEGRFPGEPRSGPCSIEDTHDCGAEALPGDVLGPLRVLRYDARSCEIEVDLAVNARHGTCWLGASLLAENGLPLSGGFAPTFVPGNGTVRTSLACELPGSVRSAWIFVWVYEANKSTAFACRRYPYARLFGR